MCKLHTFAANRAPNAAKAMHAVCPYARLLFSQTSSYKEELVCTVLRRISSAAIKKKHNLGWRCHATFQQCNPSPRHGRDHRAPPWLSFAPDGAIHRQKYAETARSLSFTPCPWQGQHGIKSSAMRWRHSGRRRHASKLRGATPRGARMLAVVCGALTFLVTNLERRKTEQHVGTQAGRHVGRNQTKGGLILHCIVHA